MLENGSNFFDAEIAPSVRSGPIYRERPLPKIVKIRNHWPFTVVESHAEMSLLENCRSQAKNISSFVT